MNMCVVVYLIEFPFIMLKYVLYDRVNARKVT